MKETPTLNENEVSIESQANYEGNHSELFFSRMENPKIKKQVVHLLFEEQKQQIENGETEFPLVDENGEFKRDKNGKLIMEKITEFESCDQIERQFESRLKKAKEKTVFDYENISPNSEVMHLGFIQPWSGKKMSENQKNIIEAHEKGHIIRKYTGSFFDDIFQQSIDLEKIEYADFFDKEAIRELFSSEGIEMDDEELKSEYIFFCFNAKEIAERMNQLKNYFGMENDETFTKEHLDYAKIHYVEDTDVDNLMTVMFNAITPEREDKFLNIINNAGI